MADTINAIVQAIATVGFPIVCCGFLLWQSSKQDEYHKEQLDKQQKTIDNNTKAINSLQLVIQDLIHYVKGE